MVNHETIEIIHITSPEIAFEILEGGKYLSFNNEKSYDAGMNFIGVLGEKPNTQPRATGAKIFFSWTGEVSTPLHWEEYNHHTPNVLFDFNGSGEHFRNNDPRYFLPYGSGGLIANRLECDENQLLEDWYYRKGMLLIKLYKLKFFHKFLAKYAAIYLRKLNNRCKNGEIIISIERG